MTRLFFRKVWCLSRDDLETELRGRPDFAMGLLGTLAEKMRGQSKARVVVAVLMDGKEWQVRKRNVVVGLVLGIVFAAPGFGHGYT